jgi:hypothetical protein
VKEFGLFTVPYIILTALLTSLGSQRFMSKWSQKTMIESKKSVRHRTLISQSLPAVLALSGKPNPDHAAILVDVPHETSGRSGKLLRNQGYVERIPVVSRYWFGDDGILTIDTEYDNNQGQERCWFITDDFRVRVGTVRMNNGVYQMTYCSERRYVGETDLEAMLQRNLARQN